MNKIKDHLTENRLREEKAYIQIKDYIIGLQNEFIMKCNYSAKQIKMKSNNKTIVKQNSLAYLLTVPTQTLKKLAGRYVDGKNIKVKPIIERLVVEKVVFLIRGSKKNGVATRYNIPWETINERIKLIVNKHNTISCKQTDDTMVLKNKVIEFLKDDVNKELIGIDFANKISVELQLDVVFKHSDQPNGFSQSKDSIARYEEWTRNISRLRTKLNITK